MIEVEAIREDSNTYVFLSCRMAELSVLGFVI